jgi:hypothetical protein
MQRVAVPESKLPPAATTEELPSWQEYRSLKDVFRTALGLVLDYWYHQNGGYKLSPAEKRKSETYSAEKEPSSSKQVNGDHVNNDTANSGVNGTSNGNSGSRRNTDHSAETTDPQTLPEANKGLGSAESIFQHRRQRLLKMLGQVDGKPGPNAKKRSRAEHHDGPPFTIQRIAEVLIAPERVSSTCTQINVNLDLQGQ